MTLLLAQRTQADDQVAVGGGWREALVEVSLNGQPEPDATLVIVDPDQGLLLAQHDLNRWQLMLPSDTPKIRRGNQVYVAARSITELSAHLDEQSQRLELDAGPALLPSTEVRLSSQSLQPTPSPPGVYVNYDLSWLRYEGTSLSGQFETGAFYGATYASSTWLATSIDNQTVARRLDTTLIEDLPGHQASLHLGDSISTPAPWGNPVRFGGIQFGTDFSTTPAFVTFPQPGVRGDAQVASTVDLYVNDLLQMRRTVPPGPFSIDDIPVAAGAGQVQLRVEDALGRQQLITEPFYATQSLLKPGLSDWSVAAGAVRNGYGLVSDRYGPALLTASDRYGFSDSTTGQLHAEISHDVQDADVGASVLAHGRGLWSADVATSHTPSGAGSLLYIAYLHDSRSYDFGFTADVASSSFRTVGQTEGELTPRVSASVHAGIGSDRWGSLSVFGVWRDERNEPDVKALSLTVARNYPGIGYFALIATNDFAHDGAGSIALNFTRPLGESRTASATATLARDDNNIQEVLQKDLPTNQGLAYRFAAEQLQSPNYDASVTWQGRDGDDSLEASVINGQSAARASASGGIAWLGSVYSLTRRLDQSFAVVDVPGLANQPIYHEQQLVTQTNSSGIAILPGLRPFEDNRISLDPDRLPINAAVSGPIEQMAVPYRHGAVLLRFDVDAVSRSVHLLLPDGTPVPTGAVARSAAHEFPVGLDGTVFVTGPMGMLALQVTWGSEQCRANVTLDGASSADLADVTCQPHD